MYFLKSIFIEIAEKGSKHCASIIEVYIRFRQNSKLILTIILIHWTKLII